MAGAVDPCLRGLSPEGEGLADRAAPEAGPWRRRLSPPRLALGLGALALGLHASVWGGDPAWGQAPAAGLALLGLGLGLMVWALRRFGQAHTPSRPGQVPQLLLDEGPFALSRNPMYLGKALGLAGLGLALGVPALLGAAVAFMAAVQVLHIRPEEVLMRQRFGGWYTDYAARVRRWL
ncbi:methyltransferase family protein [Ideonella livida]|uniref:Isoprenylcysteine carboxylmethyltransferase family protein n=1 Tax=Ideonella livida TaxID=2707176 RepID=A0A7C9PIX4_9BURK|nr:isoprenylcysteine carboxylmethyltransferase family protein [Ideonella livida]NDY92314.1 isoprenylcysteine carboxylmethyltransferase family protein [Ideonella livida]